MNAGLDADQKTAPPTTLEQVREDAAALQELAEITAHEADKLRDLGDTQWGEAQKLAESYQRSARILDSLEEEVLALDETTGMWFASTGLTNKRTRTRLVTPAIEQPATEGENS